MANKYDNEIKRLNILLNNYKWAQGEKEYVHKLIEQIEQKKTKIKKNVLK